MPPGHPGRDCYVTKGEHGPECGVDTMERRRHSRLIIVAILQPFGGERSRSISCRLRRMVGRLKIRHLVLISENLNER